MVYVLVGWWASGDAHNVIGAYGSLEAAQRAQVKALDGVVLPYDRGWWDGVDIYPVRLDETPVVWPELDTDNL